MTAGDVVMSGCLLAAVWALLYAVAVAMSGPRPRH